MPFDLSLPPKLFVPHKPAIIRASRLPESPAEARQIEYAPKRALGAGGAAMMMGGSLATQFTFVNSTTTATNSGTIPADAAPGDVCVCFNGAEQNTTVPTAVIPNGFTQVANHTRTDADRRVRGLISVKILQVGEPGASVSLMSAAVTQRGILAAFRPNGFLYSFTANGLQGQGTGGDPAQQTINVTASPSFPAISLAHWFSSGAVSSRVSTNLTSLSGSSTAHWAAYRIDNLGGSPANGVVDMADSGSQVMQSLYLTFS